MDYENLLYELIEHVAEVGASDLHLTAGSRPTMRVSGQLILLSKNNILSSKDTAGLVEILLGKEKL